MTAPFSAATVSTKCSGPATGAGPSRMPPDERDDEAPRAEVFNGLAYVGIERVLPGTRVVVVGRRYRELHVGARAAERSYQAYSPFRRDANVTCRHE